ncbi:Preprotein translocase subunit SECE1 [Abeliophyllum distichum]|uniref:Preprotein translocase subunit SECE1 n=1 Tax=Abeliophyllum distichum TaxID=126358 RepID=A0ABD1Q210_9LAMI
MPRCLRIKKIEEVENYRKTHYLFSTRNSLKFTNSTPKIPNSIFLTKASQEQENTSLASESETEKNPPEENRVEKDPSDGISELGMEIKKAMKEREQKEPDFWSGVAEEIREIEWPGFNKVLGTTGIVLGVMAGSSVVLLTVNAVLAELSDRAFCWKGRTGFLWVMKIRELWYGGRGHNLLACTCHLLMRHLSG